MLLECRRVSKWNGNFKECLKLIKNSLIKKWMIIFLKKEGELIEIIDYEWLGEWKIHCKNGYKIFDDEECVLVLWY